MNDVAQSAPPSANGQAQGQTGVAEQMPDLPTAAPPTDVFETKDAIVMLLDMPGADPDSLNVALERRMLTVSARTGIAPPRDHALIHAEFRDTHYERGFTLSDEIDGEHIDAEFKDGVLRLQLPKTTPSPAKKIQVKAS